MYVMKHYQYVFVIATYLTYVLYFVAYVGVWKNAPEYLDELQYFFKIFISLVLIALFHPFSKTTFTPFHRQVVFTAAVYLLTTTTFSIFLKRASDIKNRFKLEKERGAWRLVVDKFPLKEPVVDRLSSLGSESGAFSADLMFERAL